MVAILESMKKPKYKVERIEMPNSLNTLYVVKIKVFWFYVVIKRHFKV